MRQGKLNKAKKIILTALLNQKPDAATIDLLGKIFWVEGNIKEAFKLRKQASQMFIKSGNIKRSNQIKVWLNMTDIPKDNSKNSNTEKNKLIRTHKINQQSKNIQPQVKLNKRAVIKPNSKPEEIFLNKNKPVSTGSGVIINNGKWIITNKHVVSGSNYIVVRNGVGKVREVESVKIPESKDKDMAILILKKPFPSNHSLSINDIRDPIPGEKVYLMGYPMSSVLGRYNPSISEGIVSKASGFGELAGEFQITAKMNKGNSGGPIFNNNGQIIGIAVGKLNKKEVLNKDGFIPEDVNIGISGNVISNFLKSPLKDNFNDNKKYEATEIYKYMRPSVVFVVSQ
jgi:S1-C subfamily serine protease